MAQKFAQTFSRAVTTTPSGYATRLTARKRCSAIDDRAEVSAQEMRRTLGDLLQVAIAPDTRYATFLTIGEGRFFPGTMMEEASG